MIHLIPMKHFYGVQFLNKSVKWFVIFHQLFQSAEETFFLQFLNNMDKTCNNQAEKNNKISQVNAKFFQLGSLVGGFLCFKCEDEIFEEICE